MTLSFAPERIETWPLERLKPYARNAKTHGEDQVAKIAASMAQFGWTVPVLVAGDGEVIAGHGRILAATHLGLTEAPVIVLDHLTEAERRAYRIADNKLTELGAWDEALLAGELQELLADDFDLSVVGFSDAELDALLAGDSGADDARDGENEVPETPVDPVSRPGDLWLLGPHRLLCGDSTVATDVERVLGGVSPLLMVSDPPYGVEYDPSWRNKAGAASTRRTGKVLNDDRADWREAWALFRARGHEAVSCDLLPSERPGPHIVGDVRDHLGDGWDLLIAHPPCTFLANSGAKHLYLGCRRQNGAAGDRWANLGHAAAFFIDMLRAPIPRIAVENPIMLGHVRRLFDIPAPSQTIQPWQHGHPETKATCLWLRSLQRLTPTHVVDGREARVHREPPGPDRWRNRSRTFEGIAAAMAEQWGAA